MFQASVGYGDGLDKLGGQRSLRVGVRMSCATSCTLYNFISSVRLVVPRATVELGPMI